MRKLFQTLCEHKLCVSIGIMMIIILCLSYVRISIGNLVSHNAMDVSMLVPEMLCESGPDFKKASGDLLTMLETYTNHMEKKHYAGLLKAFYNEYSPTKGLERAKKTLEKAKDKSQEECAKDIWLAGEQVEQYRMIVATFPNYFQLDSNKYLKVPDELVGDIKIAIGESQKSLDLFKKNKTLKNAVFLCEDDRWTMLLLFLARAGYNNGHSELFNDFQKIVNEAKVEEKEPFDNLPEDSKEKKFFEHIIQSEQRRVDVLEAIKVGNMHTAHRLMWETIERAYHERPIIMEFSRAVEFGKGWKRAGS